MDSHESFCHSLTPEEEHLIIVRDFLYEGDWQEIIVDLRARQTGKPFIFKLNSRIEEDLERIERLEQYEHDHSVDLGAYLVRSGRFPELADALARKSGERRESIAPSHVKAPGEEH